MRRQVRRQDSDGILGPFLFLLFCIVALNMWGYFWQP
jgi:hypothetical protein